jgi:hypothetical protein
VWNRDQSGEFNLTRPFKRLALKQFVQGHVEPLDRQIPFMRVAVSALTENIRVLLD